MEEPDASKAVDKRRTPRRRSALEVSLHGDTSMLDVKTKNDSEKFPLTLLGHTSDLNETGLGLVLPSFSIDEEFCADQSQTLQLEVSLPRASVKMEAAPVHCEPLNKREPTSGYILGMRITNMDESDRQRFLKFLHANA
jgi:hypothetical protein